MASGAMGGSMRRLRDLFRHGTAVGLDDGQLLARFADSRDETAFEALVARHGPMVLATCRAVLKHEHDVEDAFQATFLVLARKADSVRAGDALGGWLHRVAYRAAVQASVEARLRRLREAEAAMSTHQTAHTESDIPSIIHEELDRLPDRQRLPVVLCDLEGLTYEQAARHLRWSEPTLRHRLIKARQRLRDRLIRRGVTAGAVGGIPADLASPVRAMVPASLVRSVVGGASSPTATVLSNVLIRSIFMTKLKLASAGVLAAIALATGGVFAVGTQTVEGPKRAMKAADGAKKTPDARPIPKKPEGVAKTQVHDGPILPIEGRIIDLEGRPVAGAKVELTDLWSALDDDLTRWLDQVKDHGMYRVEDGLLPRRLPNYRRGLLARLPGPPRPRTYPTTNTGPDGRFKLIGVGPAQIAKLRITGPAIAMDHLYVTGREGAEVRARMRISRSEIVFHPRKLEIVAPPTKPIEGVVRDKETGKPLAGITLQAAVYEEHSLIPYHGIEATTNDQGFYRLAGLPKAPAYRVFAEPGAGQPYPRATFRAAGNSPAFAPVSFDIALKRGIWVRGKVTEKGSGRPVQPGSDMDDAFGQRKQAYVEVFAFADNPYVNKFPGYRDGKPSFADVIDGQYEVLALPGRSLICVRVRGDLTRYRGSVGAETIRGYNPDLTAFRTYPYMASVGNYHDFAELNLDPKAESATLDLQVDPGRTITVKAVDPDGKPVAGTMASGVTDLFSFIAYPQSSSEIEVFALAPSHPRRVIVTHAGRKLIGSVYLKGDEPSPLTLRLQPSGTIVGRVVDEDGKPRGGISIGSIHGSEPENPADQGVLPNQEPNGGGIPLGRDGRFRIEGLVPGLKYGGDAREGAAKYLGIIFRDVTAGPGEVKDLGDVKAILPKRPN